MMNLAWRWNRLASWPARLLLKRLSSQLPHQYYDRIEMAVASQELEPSAERFFTRTSEALVFAAAVFKDIPRGPP